MAGVLEGGPPSCLGPWVELETSSDHYRMVFVFYS